MLRGFFIALVLSLAMAGNAEAQSDEQDADEIVLPPGTVMHRLQARGQVRAGTMLAESTGGGFSVRMPFSFNDFSMLTPSGDVLRSCAIGTETEKGLKMIASRLVYADKRKLVGLLARAKASPPGTQFSATDLTANDWPATDLVITGRGWVTWMRWIVTDTDAFALSVEAPAALESAAQPLVKPFFDSLKLEGECTGKAPS